MKRRELVGISDGAVALPIGALIVCDASGY
jgi:hypothetical protein